MGHYGRDWLNICKNKDANKRSIGRYVLITLKFLLFMTDIKQYIYENTCILAIE